MAIHALAGLGDTSCVDPTIADLPDINLLDCTFADQAAKSFCVYSSGDSEGRGGQACDAADLQGSIDNIALVDSNDFSGEFFSWDWGTGCQDISDVGSTQYTGDTATSLAATVGNTILPGVGSVISSIGDMITDIINHGAIIHNEENEILCNVVPRAAGALGSIVAAFRAGQITEAQAASSLNQTLSATQQALGMEAGRGSGQGLLRNMAVVVGYYQLELPKEAAAMAAASAAASVPSSTTVTSATGATTTTASTSTLTSIISGQLIAGLPNWALLVGGIAGVLLLREIF